MFAFFFFPFTILILTLCTVCRWCVLSTAYCFTKTPEHQKLQPCLSARFLLLFLSVSHLKLQFLCCCKGMTPNQMLFASLRRMTADDVSAVSGMNSVALKIILLKRCRWEKCDAALWCAWRLPAQHGREWHDTAARSWRRHAENYDNHAGQTCGLF